MIKRLYLFILKSFLPLFAMTFFIVLFIVLMQFLWRYVDDLVGKGLPLNVITELFFYAAVSMVPMALPLAVLLASLMTFGNLGEKFELTALKAAGISLLQVMSPLIVLISGVAVGAFFFQNNVLPHAQVKMWTLLFSMKQKSPEVEIPEGVFYDQIPGYNLFVEKKNPETGMLRKVMIYDVTKGGDNARIILTDSARIAFTKDNRYLYLRLYQGEMFENLREQNTLRKNVPFRREKFEDKEVLIPFDANFNRLDDESMRKQYVGKNISELQQTIDSINLRVDSIGDGYARALLTTPVVGMSRSWDRQNGVVIPFPAPRSSSRQPNLDSLLAASSETQLRQLFSQAHQRVASMKGEYEFKAESMNDDKKSLRRHEIELLKKFTLSVACLIMFFIGAPLGAIIRKGGLGTPLVISVLLFLVYYIIDNTGYKMARDGRWPVWLGMWISTFVLAPLGIYVTYKAMNDSAVFDKDAWMIKLRRLLGTRVKRKAIYKEVIINDISTTQAIILLHTLCDHAREMLTAMAGSRSFATYWSAGLDMKLLAALSDELEQTVDYLSDCRDMTVVSYLKNFPVLRTRWWYAPSSLGHVATVVRWIFPVSIPVYFIGRRLRHNLRDELRTVIAVSEHIEDML